jgi:hypothetical protein
MSQIVGFIEVFISEPEEVEPLSFVTVEKVA